MRLIIVQRAGRRDGMADLPHPALGQDFSHFVTSIAAPVASGWSVCRVGLAPTGKRRLVTAHTRNGHLAASAFSKLKVWPHIKLMYSVYATERTASAVCL
jgi:hypothetical protein